MENFKFCSDCGTKLEKDASFCFNCGKAQNATEQTTVEQPVNTSETEPTGATSYQPINTDAYDEIANGGFSVPQPQKKNKKGMIIGIVVAVVAVLAIIGMNTEDSPVTEDPETGIVIDTPSSNEDSEKTYEKGTLTETTYESRFIGLRFNLPSGWTMATKSELAGLSSDANTTWEMQAINNADGSNVSLATEKLPLKNLTEEAYIESLISSLESSGMTISDVNDTGSFNIAGQPYKTLSYTATQNGTTFYQTFYVRKINTHMAVLLTTSLKPNDRSMILNFSGII